MYSNSTARLKNIHLFINKIDMFFKNKSGKNKEHANEGQRITMSVCLYVCVFASHQHFGHS